MKLTLYKPLYPFKIVQGFGENSVFYNQPKFGNIKGHNGLDCIRGCDKDWTDKSGYLHYGHCYEISGANVRAAHDGEVTFSNVDGGGGYGVVVKTLDQFDYAGGKSFFKTIYWHLQSDIQVRVGQKVKVGDVLGYADSTGFSTAPHLHFGLKPIAQGENEWTWTNIEQTNGYLGAIDPAPYLDTKSAYEMITFFKKFLSRQ